MQRLPYKETKIEGWTLALQTYNVIQNLQVYHTKIHRFKGGRWPYKLTVSVKLSQSAIRRYNISKVEDYHKKYKKQGWTLALQTYTVFEICEVYHTNNFKNNQGWTLALQTYSVLEICKVYHTQLQKFNALHTYSVTEKSKVYHAQIQQIQGSTSTTPQRHTKSRVEIGVTNLQCLQCPGHMQSLR